MLTFVENQVRPGEPIRARQPPEDDRASAGRKKNSKVMYETADNRSAEPLPPIAAQYETLRMAALGEPMPPEARSGLGLFLRRGMWGWARALAAARDADWPARSSSSSSTAPDQHRAVIQVFAAMAGRTDAYRAMQKPNAGV